MGKVIPILLTVLGIGLGFGVFRGAAGQKDAGLKASEGGGFTYQGLLEVGGETAEGPYDFQFKLFDVPMAGTLMGMVSVDDVAVTDGIFSVQLDFGAGAFAGESERWLELAVREGEGDGAYSTLVGRQRLMPTPYALHAFEAGRVAWTNVQNRPAGLDDGDDDTSYTAGTGLVLAGTQFSAEGSPYGNVLVVALSGGDFSSVQAALDNIVDASAANPYLVYVGPGVYGETVTLEPYVTVEGAGLSTTIIHGTGGNQAPGAGISSATMVGADNATLRNLTVESVAMGQDYAIAILNHNTSPSISDVAAIATGGQGSYGLYNYSSSATLSHVAAIAKGGVDSWGVLNVGSPGPTMIDVTASGSGCSYRCVGVWNDFSGPTIRHSTLEGTSWSVFIEDLLPGEEVKVANSQIIGPFGGWNIPTCFNNYDANLFAITCP